MVTLTVNNVNITMNKRKMEIKEYGRKRGKIGLIDTQVSSVVLHYALPISVNILCK